MKIEASPEEIAALVVGLQQRQISFDEIAEEFAEKLTHSFDNYPIRTVSPDTP